MVVMGKCTRCGHEQPGEKNEDTVDPLAEKGCANCDNETFADAGDEGASRLLRSPTNRETAALAQSDSRQKSACLITSTTVSTNQAIQTANAVRAAA
jgi:predicted  nucleic acid-binding Zn-ribbon protein